MNLLMKYRVHYTFMDQTTRAVNKWEQREKDFDDIEDARMFAFRMSPNVAVRNINIQPVP